MMVSPLVIAMGYREDGWNSSRLWTEQLHLSLRRAGYPLAECFAPSLGRRPRWWDRRFAYPRLLPPADLFQLMDQSYGNALLGLPKESRSVALIHDIDFWLSRTWWNTPIRRQILAGLAKADRRVTVSRATAEQVKRELGLEVFAVIPPGFDLLTFAHVEKVRLEKCLLHVGTLVPRKGPDRLLRLLAELPPSWRLKQIGGAWSQKDTLLINQLKLGSRIEQRQQVKLPDLVQAYATAAALVLPSRYEGFGLPVIEARLVGTRVWLSGEVPAAEHLLGDSGAEVLDFSAFDDGGSVPKRQAIAARIDAASADCVVFPKRERFSWGRVARQFGQIYSDLGFPAKEV